MIIKSVALYFHEFSVCLTHHNKKDLSRIVWVDPFYQLKKMYIFNIVIRVIILMIA